MLLFSLLFMPSWLSYTAQEHLPHYGAINNQSIRCSIGMPISKSAGDNFSTEAHSSHVSLVFVKLTKVINAHCHDIVLWEGLKQVTSSMMRAKQLLLPYSSLIPSVHFQCVQCQFCYVTFYIDINSCLFTRDISFT